MKKETPADLDYTVGHLEVKVCGWVTNGAVKQLVISMGGPGQRKWSV